MKIDWNSLTFFEQMDHIGSEVKRCCDTRDNYLSGRSSEDYSDFYYKKVQSLIELTIKDSKNSGRSRELLDELDELKMMLSGIYDSEYIMRYWNQFTDSVAMKAS